MEVKLLKDINSVNLQEVSILEEEVKKEGKEGKKKAGEGYWN